MDQQRAGSWLQVWRRYLASLLLTNLAWEIGQLPLYTIWSEEPLLASLRAAAHCALGDLLIGMAALMLALVLNGDRDWPVRSFGRVMLVTLLFTVGYTVVSEWLNLVVRQS